MAQLLPIHSSSGIRALRDHIIVEELKFGERKTKTGVILVDDDAKTTGIRPRWGKVLAVGPEQKDVAEGQWVMVEHGRWTRGVKIEFEGVDKVIHRVDPTAILLVSDEEPEDEGLAPSTVAHA